MAYLPTLIPMDPITLSDDEQGVYNHLLRKVFRLNLPFSEGEPGSLGMTKIVVFFVGEKSII